MIDSESYGDMKNKIDEIEKILSDKLKRNDKNDLIKDENILYNLLNDIIIANEQIVNELNSSIEDLILLNENIKNDKRLGKTEKNKQINENKNKIGIRFDKKIKIDIENGKYKARFQELKNRREEERLNALKEASENLKEAAAEKARKDQEAAEKARKDQEAAEKARKDQEAAEKARKDQEAAEKARKDQEAAEKARKDQEAAEKARKDQEAAENLKEAAAEKARKDQEAAEKARKDQEAAEKARKDQEAAENLKKAAAEKARKDNYVNLKPIKIGAKTHNCRCKMKIQ
jgi:hypothetical protein